MKAKALASGSNAPQRKLQIQGSIKYITNTTTRRRTSPRKTLQARHEETREKYRVEFWGKRKRTKEIETNAGCEWGECQLKSVNGRMEATGKQLQKIRRKPSGNTNVPKGGRNLVSTRRFSGGGHGKREIAGLSAARIRNLRTKEGRGVTKVR